MPETVPAVPDISDAGFWAQPPDQRAHAFAELRQVAPVSYQKPSNLGLAPSARGYWAVTRHADVVHVSRNPELYCSGKGVGLTDIDPELMELNASFLMMDPPRHTKVRKVVSGAFTPRRVAALEEAITSEANRVVDEFVASGGGDVVPGLSRRLPLWTISSMLGVPESMQEALYDAAEGQVAAQDPEFAASGKDSVAMAIESSIALHGLAAELIAMRREAAGDDILSTLVHSEVDGESLTDQVLGGIFVLFSVAGNDTTRNSTSHGIKLFSDNPEQWQRLRADRSLLDSAVDEIVRCATPVIHFRRTTTTEVELGGARIPSGDAVVMFYESANRDDAVFADPFRFDVARNPNPHVGFGGGGPHFCLGAHLARVQLRALFGRLCDRVDSFDAGQPDYLVGNFVNGIKRMPVSLVAA
jgi:cytochrome P450